MLKLSASKCEVVELEDNAANEFVKKHHRSGSAKANSKIKSLGLQHKDTLVAVIQFSSPRTAEKKRKYTVELLRLAFHKDYRIHGGVSKLIKHYKNTYNPADIFTYQDTTGEATKVYEEAGFTLVSERKVKEYLVAPGKTLATAERGEYYSIGEVSRRGPDALLGTKLGEVFREDGKRKTNPELFIEELGWHIEETKGDRVYEWFNPNLTFYVYKITASDSDKYYIGVRQIAKANGTIEDCQKDNYYGSGGKYEGNKFGNWKKKHKNTLQKEVLSIHSRKAEAYNKEKSLIGDLWKTDSLCLNSRIGGFVGEARNVSKRTRIFMKECETHGLVKHAGENCCTCTRVKAFSMKECIKHGETLHQGDSCCKCSSIIFSTKTCPEHGPTVFVGDTCKKCIFQEIITLKTCEFHGKTKHIGESCYKCTSEKRLSMKECVEHGETQHAGESCLKCSAQKSFFLKECPIHGETKHKGSVCLTCISNSSVEVRRCPRHGDAKHRGELCYSCLAEDSIEKKECATHGLVYFQYGWCTSCLAFDRVAMKECSIHGLTKHTGDSCYYCRTQDAISMKECETHGLVKHKGETCITCVASGTVAMMECEEHGLVKHYGGSCRTCSLEKQITVGFCSTHGEVKHRGGKCYFCQNAKSVEMKECAFHGLTKHQGDFCNKCVGMRNAHKRFHRDRVNPACPECQSSES